MRSAGTARTGWFWGAVLGLCVWLGVWWIGGLGWAAGLFLGAIAMVVTALALDWLWLQGVPAVDALAYAPTRPGAYGARPLADAEPAPAQAGGPSRGATAPDDLKQIRGIGPKAEALLHRQGVHRHDQIAAWDAAEIERQAAALPWPAQRIRAEDWPGQARLLAAQRAQGAEVAAETNPAAPGNRGAGS